MAVRLECTVQRYAWGDLSRIPALLGVPPDGQPQAELWMGAHPSAPSMAGGRPLDEIIAVDRSSALGCSVDERFGQLPLLLKVLAAAEPLSIQAHPSLEQARVGFAREEALGLGRDAADRTYRDANHKPELICALTTFEAKCGFRPVAEMLGLLDHLGCAALDPLQVLLAQRVPAAEAIRAGLHWLFGLGPQDVGPVVEAVINAAKRKDEGAFSVDLEACAALGKAFPGDVGVVVSLLLNHVVLQSGQAMFLGPGVLHAYLGGFGVEVMANSDNVVRGGLTPKHIDVVELLGIVDTRPSEPVVQTAGAGVFRFESPVPEFSLTRIDFQAGTSFVVRGPALVLVTTGAADLEALGLVEQGQSVFVPAVDGPLKLDAEPGTLAWVARPGCLDGGIA